MYDYDLIVLGAGSGGISSANLGIGLGKRVALIEKNKIGGDCTWFGCVPSKTLIKSAEVAHHIHRAGEFGIELGQVGAVNASHVMSHVRELRDRVYQGETPEVFRERGIDVLFGEAKFVDNHRIQLGDRVLSSRSFIISTGSSPLVPPVSGLAETPYLTNETLFELEELPSSLVVLGGGPIGSEMASALNRLGVKITVVEMASHILSREDDELAFILQECMQAEGVRIINGERAISAARQGNGVVLSLSSSRGAGHEVSADGLLVAVGRRPNVEGMDLDRAGVAYSAKGIAVDASLRTSVKNIYAVGDVIGGYQFSHVAEYQAGVAVPNAVLPIPFKRKVDYSKVVWSTFTHPELARSGLTEKEARNTYGDRVKIYRHSYSRVDRAKTDMAEEGMSKYICDRKGKLIGIHILGERAAELMHEAQLARVLGIPFHKIQSMIHVYPTYGELVMRPASAAYVDKLQNSPFIKLARKLSRK